jgi:hypothetical protein
MNSIAIPRNPSQKTRPCGDDEAECVICGRPVKLQGHRFFLWEHCGGGTAVTLEEGERLNATGHGGGDLGGQPIGRDCLRKHPELKPFLMPEGTTR